LPLPPLLAAGLNVVFVGTEPGRESLRRGQYYADPTNGFYRHLAEAGLTPRQLRPAEFWDLRAYGMGLDDVYDAPDDLRARLESARPRAVCFNSNEALRRFTGQDKLPRPWRRDAAGHYATIAGAIVWATGDSSWNASNYWPQRIDDLRALRERLADRSRARPG
jgi:TDG/mug DNA glycosylase family protein